MSVNSINPFKGYVQVKVGTIPESKLRKALEGNAVRLTNANLSGDRVMVVHRSNAEKIRKAQRSGKGLTTSFTSGEALADLDYHDNAGAGMSGGSLWSWLRKKAWPWLKQNWSVIKPAVSAIADVAIPAAATALGAPQAGFATRGALKTLTGVGVGRPAKGSQEAKDRMAAIRAKRKTKGGSFLMS